MGGGGTQRYHLILISEFELCRYIIEILFLLLHSSPPVKRLSPTRGEREKWGGGTYVFLLQLFLQQPLFLVQC